MTELGRFTEDVNTWRRAMAASSGDNTYNVYCAAADDFGKFVSNGLDRQIAVDMLMDMASAYHISDSIDEIEQIISEAFERAPKPAPKPQTKTNGQHQQAHGPQPLELLFPPLGDGKDIPRRPWIVPGLLLRRQVTVLIAPPGSGKSLFILQMGLACEAGIAWHNWRPRHRARVLIINSEEDEDEMQRRLFASRKVMELRESGGLAFAVRPEDIVVAQFDNRTKTVTRKPMLERIVATIEQNHFDVVVVDPFAESFIGDENSANELKWAAVLWREVARRTNCAVVLIHHAKKYASEMAGDMDASRGSGSLAGVARIVATLFSMTSKDANTLGIKAEDRARYLRFDDAKANLSLVTTQARWFFKRTYTLPNEGDDLPGDEVGVLEPYTPPEDFAGMSEADVVWVQQFLKEQGPRRTDPQSSKWLGHDVGRRFNRNTHDKADREWAKRVISAWLQNHVMRIEELRDQGARKAFDFYVHNDFHTATIFDFPQRATPTKNPSEVAQRLRTGCAPPAPEKPPTNIGAQPPSPFGGEGRLSAHDEGVRTADFEGPQRSRSKTEIRIIAECPVETICVKCGQPGDVKRITAIGRPGSKSETLHEACAPDWFDE